VLQSLPFYRNTTHVPDTEPSVKFRPPKRVRWPLKTSGRTYEHHDGEMCPN